MGIDLDTLINAIKSTDEPAGAKNRAIEIAQKAFQEKTGEPNVKKPDSPKVPKPDIETIKGKYCELCGEETLAKVAEDIHESACLTCGFVNTV